MNREQFLDKIVSEYGSGYSLRALGKRYMLHHETIRQILKKRGVFIKGMRKTKLEHIISTIGENDSVTQLKLKALKNDLENLKKTIDRILESVNT